MSDQRRAPRLRSDAETLAALGTTTSQHQTAALGGHASTEAVYALAVQIAGLICALHLKLSCLTSAERGRISRGGKGTDEAGQCQG
jgi:hypothetical protein